MKEHDCADVNVEEVLEAVQRMDDLLTTIHFH